MTASPSIEARTLPSGESARSLSAGTSIVRATAPVASVQHITTMSLNVNSSDPSGANPTGCAALNRCLTFSVFTSQQYTQSLSSPTGAASHLPSAEIAVSPSQSRPCPPGVSLPLTSPTLMLDDILPVATE